MDRWMRSFFWARKDWPNGGQCLVAWSIICRPTCFGGLGVKNLKMQALALRVRWEWLRQTEHDRPWQGFSLMADDKAHMVSDSLVGIIVAMGNRVLFWRDQWIHGFAAVDIAPMIMAQVDTLTQNHQMVQQALVEERWIRDIQEGISFTAHIQVMHLRHAISTVPTNALAQDTFEWSCAASGICSTKSDYNRLCQGLVRSPMRPS